MVTVFSAPLCLHVIWNLVGSHFLILSPLGEINHFWNKHAIFRWFHVVPSVFGSIMLKCYKELRWFPFHIFSPFSEINYFWNKSAFLDGSMWFPVFLVPLCHHVIWNLVGSHFQIFSLLREISHFWNKKAFFRWFHVVPGVFGSIMLNK